MYKIQTFNNEIYNQFPIGKSENSEIPNSTSSITTHTLIATALRTQPISTWGKVISTTWLLFTHAAHSYCFSPQYDNRPSMPGTSSFNINFESGTIQIPHL